MKETLHVSGRYPSEVDVAVLFLFFAREEQTVRSFKQICKARPSRLYLYQDGRLPVPAIRFRSSE